MLRSSCFNAYHSHVVVRFRRLSSTPFYNAHNIFTARYAQIYTAHGADITATFLDLETLRKLYSFFPSCFPSHSTWQESTGTGFPIRVWKDVAILAAVPYVRMSCPSVRPPPHALAYRRLNVSTPVHLVVNHPKTQRSTTPNKRRINRSIAGRCSVRFEGMKCGRCDHFSRE